ncbi:MAG TPA: hypothetical protein VK988_08890 [Acidimicrobiales bacterium]|nr:hypothetical protein [Acidimicrobiales bacterium]
MDARLGTCLLTQRQLIDEHFMEQRTKILDIAAFLDRMDRSVELNAEDDFRVAALRRTLEALCSRAPGRVERIQMILSDPTTEPLAQSDRRNAAGAYDSDEGRAR